MQAKLAARYGVPVDELFENEQDQHFRVGPDGDWILASEVERILDLTGEGVCDLVRRGVLARRGGSSRRQYHGPTVRCLVPPGYVKISRLLRHLDELAVELAVQPFTPDQLARRRLRGDLVAVQPWPDAEHRIAPEDIERLEAELREVAKRERRADRMRRTPRGEVPEQLKEWTGSERHLAVLREARERYFSVRSAAFAAVAREIYDRGLLDQPSAAAMLDVDEGTLNYYRDVGLLEGEWISVDGFGRWAYTSEAIGKHRLEFAKRLPPPDDERDPMREKLGRHGIHLVEKHHIKNEVSKGNVEEGSREEKNARSRVRRRRQEILPRTARITVAARSGGSAKGRKKAQDARRIAVAAIAARPNLSRRALVDSVIVKVFGPEAVFDEERKRRGSRDQIYRRARSTVDTRLARSFKDEGIPSELQHLFGDRRSQVA